MTGIEDAPRERDKRHETIGDDPVTVELPAIAPLRLPNFIIEYKLGEGGMGAVYRATQRSLNRTVAIKVLPHKYSSNPTYVARLRREAIVLAKINHPNVVACYDFGEHDGLCYVVLEYLDGEGLYNLVKRRKSLPQDEALHFLKQAVVGLDAANALGIIHRDVKPENMLLAKPPSSITTANKTGIVLKIADLGLASFTDDDRDKTRLTSLGCAIGSPHFMSPEQTMGDVELDFRTDMYALGVTLYNMVSGSLPFDAPTVAGVIAKKLSETIPDPREEKPELSPRLSLLIQKMTARNRDHRYKNYGELLNDIEALEQGLPMKAQPLSDEHASLLLLPSTLEQLDSAIRLAGTKIAPRAKSAPGKPVPLLQLEVGYWGVGMGAVVVIAGGLAIYSGSAMKSGPQASIPVPVKKNAKVVRFATQSLIANQSIDGWEYNGDPKDFGFQDGLLFLQSLKKEWNMAQRAAPQSEFALRAMTRVPTDTDNCEIHFGLCEKFYLAFGVRLEPGNDRASLYVEKRDSKTHQVQDVLITKAGLSTDDWLYLRANVWDHQATFFLSDQFLVSAELAPEAWNSTIVRIAARNGIAQFQLIEVSPRLEAPK